MTTYKAAIKVAEEKIKQTSGNVYDVKLLMMELLREIALDLYLEYDQAVNQDVYNKFLSGIERLKEDEPLAHILGYTWFMGYKLEVNSAVLIPRDETEELVGNVLIELDRFFEEQESITVIDVGTGSGAIAISLKKEEPKVKMYASDISAAAVKVANQNALNNHAEIAFFVGNMLDPYIDAGIKVDILLCNPPYIPSEEELERSVNDYEPHLALFGGPDGLKYYQEVFENAPKILNQRALMAFEIGYNQREVLLKMVKEYYPNCKAEVLKDINDKDRMLMVYLGM